MILTRYAVDEDSDTLVRTWAVGHGTRAAIVATLPSAAGSPQRLALAAALSELSEALWRCYTHPASAAPSTEVNTEGWRRQQSRDGFETVLAAIMDPHQPDEDGYLTVEYDPVQEHAHRAGRALRAIGDEPLAKAVTADVQEELRAVESAERGDLGGRASQAVVLSRADASPLQVVAADAALAKDPRGSELFVEFDPTAASVAAAHRLKAAADVTLEVTGLTAERVVVTADEFEALPFETPTLVLELLAVADSPYRVVVDLVSDAGSPATREPPTTPGNGSGAASTAATPVGQRCDQVGGEGDELHVPAAASTARPHAMRGEPSGRTDRCVRGTARPVRTRSPNATCQRPMKRVGNRS